MRALAVFAVLLVTAAAVGAAIASTTIKRFTAEIKQTSATTYEIKLTNDVTSNQTFGSANVEVPEGFSDPHGFVQTVADGSKRWLAPVLNTSGTTRTLELRSPNAKNALAPGQSLVLTFSATAACSPTPYEWLTKVKQSNTFLGEGNDFVLYGDVPAVTVTGGVEVAAFAISPRIGDPQLVGGAIGPLSIEALDACGNRLTSYEGPATVGGLAGVAGSSLSFANGLASTSLTPIQPQVKAYVTVTDTNNPSISSSSNSFDVVTKLCTADDHANDPCEASDPAGTIMVTTDRPPTGATMRLSFTGLGTKLTCGGKTGDTRGALANIDPQGYTQPISMTTRWDKSQVPGTGVANFVFCMSKDGDVYEVVPACTRSGQIPRKEFFCELKRNRDGAGDLVIQYLIAPQDPWVGVR